MSMVDTTFSATKSRRSRSRTAAMAPQPLHARLLDSGEDQAPRQPTGRNRQRVRSRRHGKSWRRLDDHHLKVRTNRRPGESDTVPAGSDRRRGCKHTTSSRKGVAAAMSESSRVSIQLVEGLRTLLTVARSTEVPDVAATTTTGEREYVVELPRACCTRSRASRHARHVGMAVHAQPSWTCAGLNLNGPPHSRPYGYSPVDSVSMGNARAIRAPDALAA